MNTHALQAEFSVPNILMKFSYRLVSFFFTCTWIFIFWCFGFEIAYLLKALTVFC